MNENTVEQRIRAALTAAGDAITEQSLRPVPVPTATGSGGPRRRARWVAPLLAAAAVVAVAVGTAALVNKPNAGHHVRPGQTAVPSLSTSAAASPTNGAPTSPPTHSSTPGATATRPANVRACPPPTLCALRAVFEPLWPFADFRAAEAWRAAYAKAGTQPWHRDAGQTALLFTRDYLGFTDITMVTSTTFDAQGAHVGVGYRAPNGRPHTAAVLHLVRYTQPGTEPDAGWEVVGSDDTDFSLERPAYASRVSSPMTVGGHITGVDENITVTVLSGSGNNAAGAGASLPAGGQHSPWQLSLSFPNRGVLTIVAATGGHVAQHERFAIQGVHT
jgi:hypothetical protein